jgi:hypothetical protein
MGGPAGLSQQARRFADLDGPDGLPPLTDVRRAAEVSSRAMPSTGQSMRPEPGLTDAGSEVAAPASRIVAEAPGNPGTGAARAAAAPPSPGAPAPAFVAVAGAVAPHAPSALAAAALRQATGAPAVNRAQVLNNLGATGLSFEANAGQTDPRVNFIARTGGATVFLTPTAAVFAMQRSAVSDQQSAGPAGALPTAGRGHGTGSHGHEDAAMAPATGVALYMQIVGANPAARPVGRDELPGKVNYFIGNDPSKWHTNVPTFGRVEYPDVYQGIGLAYYGGAGGLEYEFVLSPGADAHAIALRFEGADGVELNAQGDLVVHTAAGELVQHAPVVYQVTGGQRQPVSGRFALDSGLVRFDVGAYDRSRPLVIDPLELGYSTFLGGSPGADYGKAIALDGGGNAYATGYTDSANFPTTPGGFDATFNGGEYDVFVAKLNAGDSGLVYASYLGGSGDDFGAQLAVDSAGDTYVTGNTGSANFPTTTGAFDMAYNGNIDAFVAKVGASGSKLTYCTYLGGSSSDFGYGIAVDAMGNAYAAGDTHSFNFPTTRGAFDVTYNGGGSYYGDAFAVKLATDGSTLAYGTYLGGSRDDRGTAIAVDGTGAAFVTGATLSRNFPSTAGVFGTSYDGAGDAFVVKLSRSGSSLAYGAFLGGSGYETGYGIAADRTGNAYVTGITDSANFPTTRGAFDPTYNFAYDVFVSKVSADGHNLVYATFLGGSNDDLGFGIAVDGADNAFVTGGTNSANFPTTADAFQKALHGGADAFVAELSAAGNTLTYGTYLGGSNSETGYAVAVDAAGGAYVVGATASSDFPTTPGAFKKRNRDGDYDAFVTKFADV